jgi:hypothetical protein
MPGGEVLICLAEERTFRRSAPIFIGQVTWSSGSSTGSSNADVLLLAMTSSLQITSPSSSLLRFVSGYGLMSPRPNPVNAAMRGYRYSIISSRRRDPMAPCRTIALIVFSVPGEIHHNNQYPRFGYST